MTGAGAARNGQAGTVRQAKSSLGSEKSPEYAENSRIHGGMLRIMTHYRISQAAELLGVSDDTVRRWITAGELVAGKDESGRQVIAGVDLAARAQLNAATPQLSSDSTAISSARNRLVGLVTNVISDPVMSQVEMQCGPYRVVSLMSTEAVQELQLQVGSLASAVIKATMVTVETP